MEKAVIYARVSSKEQEAEGYSIPAQQKALREYAVRKNLEVVQEFTDAETAKKAGRTQFTAMMKCFENNKHVKYLLVEKTDRLHRNFTDYVLIEDLITRSDIKIHLIKENDILSRDAGSTAKLMFGMKVLMAKNYIDNLSEEVTKGLSEKAAQGMYPSRAPYGYVNVSENGKNVIKINPTEAPFIKKMFELYALGSYSLAKLRTEMIAAGMVYRGGKSFYRSRVEWILKNEFYAGMFYWKGKRYDNAAHEPIISKDLFRSVQDVLISPYKSKSRKDLFPYTNLIKCGVCSYVLTAEIKKEKYIYYHCTGYKAHCKQPYIKQEAIEARFEGLLNNIQIPETMQRFIIQGLRESYKDKMEFHNASVKQMEEQINRLQGRIDQAYMDKLDRKISEEFWDTNHKRWLNEKETLLIKMMAAQRADAKYLEYANLILELANKASGLFKIQNAEQKRRMVSLVTSNCVYKDGKLDLELKPVFNEIMKSTKTGNWCA